MNRNMKAKLHESLAAVLPISLIVGMASAIPFTGLFG